MIGKTMRLEAHRSKIQEQCDELKTAAERNRLGQFATPALLATQMLQLAKTLIRPRERVRFLDPAFGTGAFYSALLRVFDERSIQEATGFEIDAHYGGPARELWRENKLQLHIEDFTKSLPPKKSHKYNLIVCNPPYVRHHHLNSEQKARLRNLIRAASGASMSGLAGLYCYFLLLSISWAEDGATCVWLIPSEFMDVNYGRGLKEYLLKTVTLIRIHRFDPKDLQFGDALVSSSIVCFRNSPPSKNSAVDLTFGGDLTKPAVTQRLLVSDLNADEKWNRQRVRAHRAKACSILADFFQIKRGLATGDNKFFILTSERAGELQLPSEFLRPILPSPRYLQVDEIRADARGNPVIDRLLFLLDCPLPEATVKEQYPKLWKYLATGYADVAAGYLCRSRSPWYAQEKRPAPLFLCTYMGRRGNGKANSSPFRFLLNHSKATAANVYLLLYPKAELREVLEAQPELAREIWSRLNLLSPETFLDEGRVYGGGLYKLEPRELGNVPADDIVGLAGLISKRHVQLGMFPAHSQAAIART